MPIREGGALNRDDGQPEILESAARNSVRQELDVERNNREVKAADNEVGDEVLEPMVVCLRGLEND